jgi:hypothetical protein
VIGYSIDTLDSWHREHKKKRLNEADLLHYMRCSHNYKWNIGLINRVNEWGEAIRAIADKYSVRPLGISATFFFSLLFLFSVRSYRILFRHKVEGQRCIPVASDAA